MTRDVNRRPGPRQTVPLVSVLDRVAVFVFAIEGAIAASYYDIDFFGVFVLAFSTCLVGGIVRDVLIGDVPPASLRTRIYPILAFSGALLVLLLDRAVAEIPRALLQVTDALGLGLFSVVGAMKALDFNIRGLTAALLGAVSACGGGVVRDMMLNIVPVVLRTEIYAVAALLGASVTVALVVYLKAGRALAMTAGFVACAGLRLLAVWQNWSLPHVG